MYKTETGMTLIELIIAVAIIAILAAIAIPNYERYVSKSNRVDATTEIMKLAAAQEKFYLQNNSYATEPLLAAYITGGTTLETQSGYYGVAVTGKDGLATPLAYQQGYVLTLTPPTTSRQFAKDKACRDIIMDQTGKGTSKNDAGTDSTDECW